MELYARVSVNVPAVSGCFDYSIPDNMRAMLTPGCLVEVPFGRQLVQGVVLELVDEPEVADTREIQALIDPLPVLTPFQVALARVIPGMFLCTISQAVDLMVPAGISQQADVIVTAVDSPGEDLSGFESQLFTLLTKKGQQRGRQLTAAFPKIDWKPAVKRLEKKELVTVKSYLPGPTVQPKLLRTVQSSVSPAEMQDRIEMTQGATKLTAAATRRLRVMEFLKENAEPVALQWIYAETAAKLADLQSLVEEGCAIFGETEWIRDPLAKVKLIPEKDIRLTADQVNVLEQVSKDLSFLDPGRPTEPVLLHGVAGSGKTEIYLRAAEQVIRQGKQVIILVPEISLTPQVVRRFMNRFPGRVGLYHSRLSPGERYDTWRRARAGKLDVVVGARSALFVPLPQPGLVVVDECHDDSYCQGDFGIYYDAREVATRYAKITGAACIMGSATPNVSQRYRAEKTGWKLLELPRKVHAYAPVDKSVAGESPATGAQVEIIDMRRELVNGNKSIISRALQSALAETLAAGQQAILYLNRRGMSTYVFCRACGFVLKCPRCDLTLTRHGEGEALLCHQCGYRRNQPLVCPECSSTAIRHLGAGTESVEVEVRKLLPRANILRWDAETTQYKDAHEIILSHFMNHRTDILVGTQMVSKGLDFPDVTLVGAILAETGLSLPDYRAGERVFQHLAQAAGRAGRSTLRGRVIFQTFQPENGLIRLAAAQDYAAFYNSELQHRRVLAYPPFTGLVRVEFSDISSVRAEQKAGQWAGMLRGNLEQAKRVSVEVIGPVPCYFQKVNNVYRWQVLLRGADPVAFLNSTMDGFPDCRIEVDPPNLL